MPSKIEQMFFDSSVEYSFDYNFSHGRHQGVRNTHVDDRKSIRDVLFSLLEALNSFFGPLLCGTYSQGIGKINSY